MLKRCLALAALFLFITPAFAADPAPLKIKPLAEKKVTELPAGTLFWRVESVPNLDAGRAAAGQWGLVAESDGKAWLFTLGAQGGSTGAGKKVAEVGPIPRPQASEYLLRINEATGAPGSITSVHTRPGSEAFYVLKGEQTIRGAHGTMK